MSLVIETFLICDTCRTMFGFDSRHRTGTEHRIDAKEEGWRYSGNKDYCPRCVKKTKDGKIHKSR
jgi:hypothetical protein